MVIKYSLIRIFIFFLLVIIFPFAQKQWLNLYLFNINTFTIYKVLYYLSGLIVPVFVVTNSLNKFTYYKYNFHNKNNNISGKLLLLIAIISLTVLSILITHYFIINLKLFLNLFLINNEYLLKFDIDKQFLFVMLISILLILKKTKFLLKKIILTNFFIFSIIIWYSQINDSNLIEIIPFYIFEFGNINFLNIAFLIAIEIVYYLWSYISYGSNLSDWNVPITPLKEFLPILNIVMFYFFIILYYSLLFD